MENENITISPEDIVEENQVETKPESVDIGTMPIDDFIEEVINQTKTKYPEIVDDKIIEDIRKIITETDSLTRVAVIKRYRKAIKEYHKFDDIDGALAEVEKTQREVSQFLKQFSDQDKFAAVEAQRAIEHDILSRYGLHFATPTNTGVDINDAVTIGNIDMESIRKEAVDAQKHAHIYKVAAEASYRRKMAQTPENHTLTDDVIEQLMHDHDTIEASTDLNKKMKLDTVNEVIDAVEAPSFDPIKNKTENVKGLMNTYKEYCKDPAKANNLIRSIGFNDAMVDSFISFFSYEVTARNTNAKAFDNIEFDQNLPIRDVDHDALIRTAKFFLYHIARICDTLKKRNAYKSIIYKMYILRIIEIQTSTKASTAFEDRFITSENGEVKERDEYALRSSVYNAYASMLITCYAPVYGA